MKAYELLAEPRVARDLLQASSHYERQREGLGDEFLDEIEATYDRVQQVSSLAFDPVEPDGPDLVAARALWVELNENR